MDKQSIFFTCVTAIVATSLMLMAIKFLAKKQNIKPENGQKNSISYTLWIIPIFITFFLFLKVALDLTENSIELIIFSKSKENAFLEVMQKIAIFIGFAFIFTFLSNYIVHNLLKLIIGNRIESIEIENENNGYFILKGILLISLVYSLLTIFEHFLKWFMPTIDLPFYH